MLRENRDAQIVIVDKNLEAISRNVCRVLQLDANRYSKQIKDGNEIRKYNNRVTIIGADLLTVELATYLSSPSISKEMGQNEDKRTIWSPSSV